MSVELKRNGFEFKQIGGILPIIQMFSREEIKLVDSSVRYYLQYLVDLDWTYWDYDVVITYKVGTNFAFILCST